MHIRAGRAFVLGILYNVAMGIVVDASNHGRHDPYLSIVAGKHLATLRLAESHLAAPLQRELRQEPILGVRRREAIGPLQE